MLPLSSPSKRDRVTPAVVTVVPTICEPREDVETGAAEPTTVVAVASAVPVTTWSALNPTVMPEPVPRGQNTDALEREQVLLGLYQRSRFIRIVAILDFGFLIVFGLFQPVFFILLPCPICGYFGAKKWVYWLLFIYTVYLVIEVIGGIISLVYIHSTAYVVVRVISILGNTVIARYSTNLSSYILVMTDQDFEFLKNSPAIVNTEKSLLC
jgi:hypothetical protein